MYQISYLFNHYSSKIILYRKDEHYNRTLRTLIKTNVEHRTLIKKGKEGPLKQIQWCYPTQLGITCHRWVDWKYCLSLSSHLSRKTLLCADYISLLLISSPLLVFWNHQKIRNWLILYHSPGEDNTSLLSVWFFSISPQRSVTWKQSKEEFNLESLA